MWPDLQRKPYEALRVQSGGKCWSPSDIENDFKREKWSCNVSKQRARCAWDQTDEWRCRQQWTSDWRCDWRQCMNAERWAEGLEECRSEQKWMGERKWSGDLSSGL